jgi:pimeloyl-ACP methyl ester carboxylesterase
MNSCMHILLLSWRRWRPRWQRVGGCLSWISLLITLPVVAADPPWPGQRFDVGGHALHLHCLGRGQPAVILDAGLGGSASDWRQVQSSLAKTTQVCTYDRAGYGASDPGPLPRTSGRLAAELRTLLANARIPPPYVLAGHSFGGYNLRLFASLYPQDTAGLVLVDSPHEGQMAFFEQFLLRQIDPQGVLQGFLQPDFLNPLLQTLDVEPFAALLGLPVGALRAVLGELAAFRDSSQELRTADLSPDLPLVVIIHGRRLLPDGALGDQMEQQWLMLQRDLVARQRNGKLVIAQDSGHLIPLTQPELIVAAIRPLLVTPSRR